jgi:hypothetical protein
MHSQVFLALELMEKLPLVTLARRQMSSTVVAA